MKIAVVGVGYWGPNLVRNFLNNSRVNKVYCCDPDKSRLDSIRKQFPVVEVLTDFNEVLQNNSIDAVVIATPVSTHYPLARKALEAGKHVFVEKPITASSREAEHLIELAGRRKLVLMVDHIFIFNGAVIKIKDIIDSGEIGKTLYFDAVRINLGLFQHDVNVLWDLAIHDLSIMNHLLEEKPKAVSAVGINHFNTIEDISYLTLFFESNCIGHFHVNWLAPVKIRRILIGGTKKMIVYDEMETVEKIRVYDKGVEIRSKEGIYKTLIQYRTGDMYAPKFDNIEALSSITQEFIRRIHDQDRVNCCDGTDGLRIVRILEAAEKSIKNKGRIVDLDRS
jgi:predicted dehydrogenase